MNHLDEGTIHAWLDGALDSAQSGDIELHIAQCSSCAAAVAEARGLVAGASRILNALDDVPANVVPKRAPAVPAAPPMRRHWRAAPWVTGIAAALVLVIGLAQLDRAESPESVFMAAKKEASDARPLASLADSAQPLANDQSAPPAASPAEARVAESDTRQRREGAASERQSALTDTRQRGGAGADAQTAPLRAEVGAVAGSQGAANQAARGTAGQRLPALAEQKLDEVVVTSVPVKSAVAAPEIPVDLSAGIDRLAGCYRIAPEALRMNSGAVAKAAGAVGRVAATPGRSSAARYAAPTPPDVIRLDTSRHPLGYVAKDARSGSSVGTWRDIRGDSARVDLLTAGLFTFALKNRIACPER